MTIRARYRRLRAAHPDRSALAAWLMAREIEAAIQRHNAALAADGG